MKKLVTIFLFVTTFLASCSKKEENFFSDQPKPKYVKTQVIKPERLTKDIKLIGKVSSSQETFITPLTSGVIKKVNVKVGDRVSAQDILAVIDTESNLVSNNLDTANNIYKNTYDIFELAKESALKELEGARIALENAKNARENTYKSTEEQLKVVQTQLENIKTQLKNAKKTSSSSLDLARKSLESASLNLENFEKNYIETMKTLDTKKENLSLSISGAISNYLASIDHVLTYADTILGVTNENKNLNDSYEVYLSAKNTSYKKDAEDDFLKARLLYESVYSSKDTEIDRLNKLYELVNVVVSLYENLVKVGENTITSINLPDSSTTGISLNSIKSNIKAHQNTILSIKSGVISLQNSWNDLLSNISSTKTSLETNRLSLNQALITAQANFENTKNSIDSNLDTLSGSEALIKSQLESTLASIKQSRDASDNALKIAQSNYDAIKAKLDSFVLGAKNQLDSAAGQKRSVQEQYKNSFIRAPFSGVIVSKNVEVGTFVGPQFQAFSISNGLNKIVKLDVSLDNLKYFSLGKKVSVLKNGKTGTGTVSVLTSFADPQTKMFRVEITLDNRDLDKSLVLGEFVDILVKADFGAQESIVIPFSALTMGNENDYFVYTVGKDSRVKKVKVSVGEISGDKVIITSGLNFGDRIVIEGGSRLSSGDRIEEIE